MKLFVGLLTVLLFVIPRPVQAQEAMDVCIPDLAKLTWDKNSESDLAGYKVYMSTVGEQDLSTIEGKTPIADLTVADFATGLWPINPSVFTNHVDYWFTVTAYDNAGNESAPAVPAYCMKGELPFMLIPEVNTILDNSTVTFSWDPGRGWDQIQLGVGTTIEAVSSDPWGDIAYFGTLEANSITVPNIPINGQPIHVRLWYQSKSGVWKYTDYLYQTTDTGAPAIVEDVQVTE